MYIANLLAFLISFLSLAASNPVPSTPSAHVPTQPPFALTYLFTATLALGKSTPPFLASGSTEIVVQQILNGTISGPAIQGTITGGLASPTVYESTLANGTKTLVQNPVIGIIGTTSDGTPFYVSEVGIGTPAAQVSRIIIDIGGGPKYATLRDGFVLASINHNADLTEVEVEGYLVTNTASFGGE